MNARTNILVIDDEEVVRLSHQRTLANDRCKVVTVMNGRDALKAMGEEAFDVVLLDLRMPGMDGMSVLKAIKQNWPECEVIIITGYPEVATAKQAVAMGAWDYLAKPVGPDDVIHAANAALQHKRWALHRDAEASRNRPVADTNLQ